jgi:hypothetical protein
MADPRAAQREPQSERKPYTRPTLRVFGTVAAITAAATMTGMLRDGGPNNLKT